MPIQKSDALAYHSWRAPWKIEVTPTKPCRTQRDLSMAYTPGVAVRAWKLRRNRTTHTIHSKRKPGRVVSNGTAVLVWETWSWRKPVMEGKAVLFKRSQTWMFRPRGGLDESRGCDQSVPIAGANVWRHHLEDIKAPECFYHRETLRRR